MYISGGKYRIYVVIGVIDKRLTLFQVFEDKRAREYSFIHLSLSLKRKEVTKDKGRGKKWSVEAGEIIIIIIIKG